MIKAPARPLPVAGLVIGAAAVAATAIVLAQAMTWSVLQASNHSGAPAQPVISRSQPAQAGSISHAAAAGAPAAQPSIRSTLPGSTSTSVNPNEKVMPPDRCQFNPSATRGIQPMCEPAHPQP